MSSGYSNRHHGVPRSFLGSGEGNRNLSIVDVQEHAQFHEVAGHIPPDYFLRRSILSTVDWRTDMGEALPSDVYFQILDELTVPDWRSMYEHGSIRTHMSAEHDRPLFAKAAIHVQNHVCAEQYAVADALNAVLRNANVSPERTAFRDRLGKFFGNDNPAKALRTFLIDSNDHDLKWVKPLSQSVRSRILTALTEAKPERPGRYFRRNMEDILEEHRQRLQACIDLWEPRVSQFESFIMQHRELPFFQRYLSVKENLV
jgi:hypothetical protein